MPWLYEDSYAGSATPRGADDASWHITMFEPLVDADLQAVRIAHPAQDGGTGNMDAVRVWDYSDGSVLWDIDLTGYSFPADSLPTWQVFVPDAPISLVANRRYVVGYHIPTGMGWSYQAGAPSMPSPAAFDVMAVGPTGSASAYTGRWYGGSTFDVLTDPTWYSDHRCGADVYVGSSAPSGGGDALGPWLSSNADVQAHEADGLPYQTKSQVDLIKTAVDSLTTALANVPKTGDSDWTVAGKLWQIAGALSEVEIAAWNAFAQRAPSQLTGASGGGGSAFYGPNGTQVADAAEQSLALLQSLTAPPPPASWVSQGTITFDTSITWEQEADIYTITFSDLGAGSINTTAGLADVSYRLAWWSPWNGSAARDRRFIDFPTFQAFDGGRRMPGIVLLSPQGASGTIEAFTYQ